MADATLPLNPVTPLYQGAPVASTNPLAVQTVATTGQGWTYFNTVTGTTAGLAQIVKASAGTVHSLSINVISVAGSVTIIDAAATAATPVIATVPLSSIQTLIYDTNTTAGIVLTVISTATAPNITLTYK